MNKRRHQRVEVQNLAAVLSDGVENFSATVSEICRLGMLLHNVPQRFQEQGKKLTVTVCAKDRDFKMQVESKWVSGKGSLNKMGVELLSPSFVWNIFVMIYEPAEEDIWAAAAQTMAS